MQKISLPDTGARRHTQIYNAHVQAGDELLRFDGRPVSTSSDIFDRIGYTIGRTISIEVCRSSGSASGEKFRVETELTTSKMD